jgi:hypothetical protein
VVLIFTGCDESESMQGNVQVVWAVQNISSLITASDVSVIKIAHAHLVIL